MIASSTHPAANEEGSTLLELLMGTVLVVTFVGAMLSSGIQLSRQRQTSLETTLAMNAAIDNLERVRNAAFASLPGLNGADFDVPARNGTPGGLRAVPGDADGLPGELTVVIDQYTGGAVLYRVTAAVVWTGVYRTRRLQLDTLIAERK